MFQTSRYGFFKPKPSKSLLPHIESKRVIEVVSAKSPDWLQGKRCFLKSVVVAVVVLVLLTTLSFEPWALSFFLWKRRQKLRRRNPFRFLIRPLDRRILDFVRGTQAWEPRPRYILTQRRTKPWWKFTYRSFPPIRPGLITGKCLFGAEYLSTNYKVRVL